MARKLTVNEVFTLARSAFEAEMGVQGIATLYTACKYPTFLTTEDFVTMYEREGIPSRVVDIWPDECWGAPPDVYEDADPETETEWETAFETLCKERGLWSAVHEVDRLSGVGEYGGVYIGIDDTQSIEDLAKPPRDWPSSDDGQGQGYDYGIIERGLPPVSVPAHKMMFLRPLSQNNLTIDVIETNPTSTRYGLPTLYSVRFGGQTATNTGTDGGVVVDTNVYKIHWTRIVHVPSDGSGANPVLGRPRLKRVYNRCLDLVKAYGGSAQSLWNGGFPGISFETAPGFEDAEVEDEAGMKQQMAEYASGFRRWVWAKGLKANQLQPGITEPSKFIEAYLQEIGAAIGVPWRKLMGSEQGQLASGQDGETWEKRVEGRCRGRCTDVILLPLLRRLVWLGCLPIPKDIKVEWKSRTEPKPSEIAATAKAETDALGAYVEKDIAQLIPPAEYLEQVLRWPADRVEAVQAAAGSFQDFERLRKATHDAAVKGAEQLASGQAPTGTDKAAGGPAAGSQAQGKPPGRPGKPAPTKAPAKAPKI